MDIEEGIHEVCSFLTQRNVSPAVVAEFRKHKMDKGAIWGASETDLNQLGLTERGDIIRLKAFAVEKSENKKKLGELITNAGKERPICKKSRKEKAVTLGWVHYQEDSKKYSAVRLSNGGGTRKHYFPNNAKASDIVEAMKNIFFPDGNSKFGKLKEMLCFLGNYHQKIIDEDDFTLINYIHKNKFTKTRLYLVTKKKSISQIERGRATDNFLNENDNEKDENKFHYPTFENSSIDLSIHSESYEDFHNAASERRKTVDIQKHVSASHVKPECTGLISTSSKREELQNEIDKAYNESLRIDQEERERKEYMEKGVLLQERRKARMPVEPDIEDDHVVISIRHPQLGTKQRLFRGNAKMNNAYDWMGSLSPEPMYFKFSCGRSALIPASAPVSNFTLTTLNMTEVNEPLPFEEDEEITMIGFQEKTVFDLHERRKREKEKLVTNYDIAPYVVERQNVFSDLKIYVENADITSNMRAIRFLGEEAFGEGVTRDVYSQFFKYVFRFKSAGLSACVPISLNEDESIYFGKILTHYFIQCNTFTTSFPKAILEYILFDKVRHETLRESFYNYVSGHEKALILRCLESDSLTECMVQDLCDIFSDCGVAKLPTVHNIQQVLLEAAKKVFIQKPYFTLKSIQTGFGEFWKPVTLSQIDYLWNTTAPTPLNILSNMDFTGFKSRAEERGASYLQRYINSSSPYNLELLLQFCTGCTTVDHNEKIKVEYVNQDSTCLNIASKTCFKILYIPRQIDSFNLFKTICDGSLQNPEAWRLDHY